MDTGKDAYTIDSAREALEATETPEQAEILMNHIAAETGWPIVDGCLVPEPGMWHADDGNAEVTGEFASGEEAAEDYVSTGEWGDREETSWVTVFVWREAIDQDGEIVRVDEGRHKITVAAEEPKCADGQEHDWQRPLSIVGGIEENPGVWGNGGGVTIQEVCLHCGCGKITDTWAQDPSDGEQGLTSVTYEPHKYDTQELLAGKVEFRLDDLAITPGKYLIVATLNYLGLDATATYVVEADSEGYSENPSDTDTWPGPDGWPEPPQSLIDEARAMIDAEETSDAKNTYRIRTDGEGR